MRESAEFFKRLAGNKPVNICELGVAAGKNAWVLRNHFNCQKLYLIDSWNLSYRPIAHDWLVETARKFEGDRKVYIIKSNSIDAVSLIPDNSLDYLYIDDLHNGEHVKKEIELYLPKVKLGGIIGFHDYDTSLVGRVADAVSKYTRENNIKLFVGDLDCWWIK